MIEILRDIRKTLVFFYRLSDLLTHLKFQYSKVIHITSFLYWCGFEKFQILTHVSQECFLVSGVYSDIYPLFFCFVLFSGLFFEHSTSFKERRKRRRDKTNPWFIHMTSRRAKESSPHYLLIDQHRGILYLIGP